MPRKWRVADGTGFAVTRGRGQPLRANVKLSMAKLFITVALVGVIFALSDAWSEPAAPDGRLCVVIDPGHGGRDTGSVGRNGLKEKDVTLDIAQRLRALLEGKLRAKVVLTRKGDYYMSLEDRANEANRAKGGSPADLLISVHANACMEPAVNGFQVFYASQSRELSLDEVVRMQDTGAAAGLAGTGQTPGTSSQGWAAQYQKHNEASNILASAVASSLETRLTIPKLTTAPAVLKLLRNVDMPAVLVEVGFLSNGSGETMLAAESFRGRCADALSQGIASYRDQMRDRLLGAFGSVSSGARNAPATTGGL